MAAAGWDVERGDGDPVMTNLNSNYSLGDFYTQKAPALSSNTLQIKILTKYPNNGLLVPLRSQNGVQ